MKNLPINTKLNFDSQNTQNLNNNQEIIEDNIFTEEFKRVSNNKQKINLTSILKMSVLDDNGEYKINLCHVPTLFFLDEDKDGLFTLKDFSKLSKICEEKEKEYKRYEFSAQIQAYFTLLMWKKVCSEQGERDFVNWIKKLVIINNNDNNNNNNTSISISLNNDSNYNNLESEEEENPDPNKYIDRQVLMNLYNVLNVSTTHGIDFQSFFELMKMTSNDMEEIDVSNTNDDYVLVSVLEFFCVNFIRGFSKLILDLGFDTFMENDFEI